MNTENKQIGSIDLTPSWESATIIYIGCLENPDASESAKQCARDDLIKLARTMDKIRNDKKSIASLENEK